MRRVARSALGVYSAIVQSHGFSEAVRPFGVSHWVAKARLTCGVLLQPAAIKSFVPDPASSAQAYLSSA